MLVTHSTVFDGNIQFNTVTVTVNVCLITHIDLPADPTDPNPIEYVIHALNDITIDLSATGFQQRPACGYTLSENLVWSFNPALAPPIITNANSPYTLLLRSSTNSDAGVYTATLTNAISYQSQSFMPEISFQITVTDPCLTTVITSFDLNASNSITQEAGVTVETIFNEPADSAGTAVGDQSICGPKTYEVVYRADKAAQSLVTI